MKPPAFLSAERFFAFAERHPLSPWLSAFGLVALVAAIAPTRFLISDDVGILRNLEQGFETPFISMLLGKALIWLYRSVSAHVPWYGLMLYAAHGFSLALFLSAVLRMKSIRAFTVPFVALYLAVYAGFLLRVSFNAASVMIGANALLAWLAWVTGDTRPGLGRALGLGVAFGCSYLVRVAGFHMVLLVTAPVFLVGAWHSRRQWAGHLVFLGPVILMMAMNAQVLRHGVSEEYRQYSEFNRARGRFMDYPVSSANTNNLALMALNGWTANDYQLLTQWFFFDEQVFGKDKLHALLQHPDLTRTAPDGHMARTISAFFESYRSYLWILLLGLAGAPILCSRRIPWVPILYTLYAITLMVSIALIYRLPPRMGWPAFLTVIGGLIFLSIREPSTPPSSSRLRTIWLAAVIITTGLWMINIGNMSLQNRADRHELHESVSILRNFPEDTLFIAEPAVGVRWENMSPLQTRRSMPENILPSGWTTFSPLFYSVIRRNGFSRGSGILPSAVDNPRVLFILQHADFAGLITTYLRDHTGQLARMEPVRALSGKATIYRLVADQPAAKE